MLLSIINNEPEEVPVRKDEQVNKFPAKKLQETARNFRRMARNLKRIAGKCEEL